MPTHALMHSFKTVAKPRRCPLSRWYFCTPPLLPPDLAPSGCPHHCALLLPRRGKVVLLYKCLEHRLGRHRDGRESDLPERVHHQLLQERGRKGGREGGSEGGRMG